MPTDTWAEREAERLMEIIYSDGCHMERTEHDRHTPEIAAALERAAQRERAACWEAIHDLRGGEDEAAERAIEARGPVEEP